MLRIYNGFLAVIKSKLLKAHFHLMILTLKEFE